MLINKNLRKIMLTGMLAGTAFNSAAADSQTSTQTNAASESEHSGDVMTVYSPKVEKEAGTKVTITADDMQKNGVNDFSNVMRYQPLISANGSAGGTSSGKSAYDRGGSTGYNIRGLDANRVSIDIDGVELPAATDRAISQTSGRSQLGTYGIGRGDYLDPYMYGSVDIESGATAVSNPNSALGGSVSFTPKSANDYLNADKNTYFGYQSDYDSSNRSWHNGITAAAGDDYLRGVIVVSRRDGNETENHSDATVDSNPANWHSDAILASGIWQATENHQLTGTLDYYHKTNHTHFPTWTQVGQSSYVRGGTSYQHSETRRYGASLTDRWTPDNNTLADELNTKVFYTKTQAHDYTYETTPTYTWTNYDTDTFGLETSAIKDWGRHSFNYGLSARTTKAERPLTQAGTTAATLGKPQADSNFTNLGAFVQDTISWDLDGHDFAVVPGVRWAYQYAKPKNLSDLMTNNGLISSSEVDNMYGTMIDSKVLPSLSLLYKIKPDLTTYLQYKRAAQFPTANQLYGAWSLGYGGTGSSYATLGSPDLQTETSDNYELGLKGQLVEGVTIHAAAFYNDYKNFIGITRYACPSSQCTGYPSSISTVYQYENRDKAYIYGGELSAKFNLGTWFDQVDGLSARLAYGYSKGASKSDLAGDGYVDLESVAPMKAIVGVAYDDPSQIYGAALTATFNKGKQASDTSGRKANTNGAVASSSTEYMRVPGYGVVDLTAYYRISKNVKLSGGVYNVTDRKYWDYLSSRNIEAPTSTDASTDKNYYDQQLAIAPGRSFQLGVNVDF
ncbi:TonB-dependent receptor [Brenneria goodwinii]|uniref:TonB-dependent receptor n=1 Tax=Brenneria goodwinii TaxID=1109412 RepID=A0AAE8ENJ7_9GAMM|nr:TonB-dependent hemoglobin/transferrin/lactoferrin family receptor [Brenneria goodwinii]ATA25596.1 TonB-dependent receptor [Brenneria goodwinii]RLM24183.1 TonB-dependent receptor [Brenneria goodwinii]